MPLIGEEGWAAAGRAEAGPKPVRPFTRIVKQTLAQKIASFCEPFESIETARLDRLLARIGDARVVLLGEASHGTSEFYRMRDRISRELIAKKGFRFVAIEGDWPDAARVDHYVRHLEYRASEWTAFARFPTWMWRNDEVRSIRGLAARAQRSAQAGRAGRLSWARSVQPVRFDPRCSEVSR